MTKPGETFHPWRRMRQLGPAWTLKWAALEGDSYGHTCHRTKTITLHDDMTFEERRCTIAHEVEHAIRGPVPEGDELAEELAVDQIVARLLIPSVRSLCDALIWHRGDYERAAVDLWVDTLILEVRISSLEGDEIGYYRRRMADVMLVAADE